MPEPMTDFKDRLAYANAMRIVSEQRIETLTQKLVDGDLTVDEWKLGMRAEMRKAWKEQFITGRGGSKRGLKPGDYGQLAPGLKAQYKYLERFGEVVAKAEENGNSTAFAVKRAKLYAKSSQVMFWRSALPVRLPQVPRDGKTECLSNCRCQLDVRYKYGENSQIIEYHVYWKLNPAEHCQDCKDLAKEWRPLKLSADGQALTESWLEEAVWLLIQKSPELAPVANELRAMWGVKGRAA